MSDNFFLAFVNNHTSVWGSWYDLSSGSWGYACCQSTLHISYCAGQAGIEAAKESSAQHMLASTSAAASAAPPAAAQIEEKAEPEKDESQGRSEQNYSKKRVGEGDIKLDNARLAKAIEEEKKRKMRGEEDDERYSKKKKGVPESGSHDVTEEELGTSSLRCLYYYILAYPRYRGVPNDSSTDGGSDGQLRRHGRLVNMSQLYSSYVLYILYASIALLK